MNLQKEALKNFKPGIYLHYIGLEVEGAKEGPRHMVRTWEDWNATVHKDGTVCNKFKAGVCQDTKKPVISRFRYLAPFYEVKMLKEKNMGL